ncbi:MAG TPA: hypothetical protein PKD85_19810, partial [Saprospiraceae bacterium]|nr:hypothetical protein [Saprospiraceae bacterium]
ELEKLPKYSEFSGQPFYFILRTLQTTEYYQQATYLLLHPTKGEIPVFLVPLGLDHIGMKYQAIFN